MRAFACLVVLALVLGGCSWNETLLVVANSPLTQEAISQGVSAGVDYGNTELELGLSTSTRAELAEKIAEKVVDELRKLAETPDDE